MSVAANSLKTNRLHRPLGIAVEPPEFSWAVAGNVAQESWEVEVRRESDGTAVWTSGMTAGAEPWGVRYAGETLSSRTRYTWRVRLRLSDGSTTGWSEPSEFETGIGEGEWSAQWISAPDTGSKSDVRALHLRKNLDLPAAVVRGRAYVTALGWYRLFVNQTDVTGDTLVPRWTPFHDYVEYQAYDITDAFTPGDNVVGMVVAEGRYRGHVGALARPRAYGDRLAALAQIILDLADGSTVTVLTDGSWRSTTGRTITADPMNGERADLRVPEFAWLGLDRSDQGVAADVVSEQRNLQPEEVERIGEVGRLAGTVSRTPAGVQLVDFGQNFAGVPRVRLSGSVGATVKLMYSELLLDSGELATGYLGMPGKQTEWFQRDEVVLGAEPVVYQPALTIHGFRYLAIEGPANDLTDADVEGVVLSTGLESIATFSASDERLNTLWSNVSWSLRSNFTDTPSDCPTRERSGWTGDIQVFGSTAAQLVDADAYLRRYLRNVAAEQYDDGRVPPVIPAEDTPGRKRNPLRFASTSAGWGDVTVMLPWTLYQYYGDKEVLRRQYDSAKAWVDQLERRARRRTGIRRRLARRVGELERYIVDTGYHWGEWLRPGAKISSEFWGNFTGKAASVATAYLANSARLLGDTAEVLGEHEDAARYHQLATRTKAAWRAAFVSEGGARIDGDRQDDYVRGLAFDLLTPTEREAAGRRLAELIEAADYHLATGFLSTPMLLESLVDAGYPDHAFRLLLQQTSPSWLGQIALGATSIWETWDGYKPTGEPYLSHNHYAFGAVVKFLHERVAGLAPAAPGYRRIRVAPVWGHGLTSASASVRTPYGLAAVEWHLEGSELHLTVTVPPGATADVEVGDLACELTAGTYPLTAGVEVRGGEPGVST